MNRDATSANHLLQGLAKQDPQLTTPWGRLSHSPAKLELYRDIIWTLFGSHSPKKVWQIPPILSK